MAIKTKNNNTIQDVLTDTAQSAGIVLMAAAATMLNMPEPQQPKAHMVMPTQSAFAVIGVYENMPQGGGQQERREREETGPHYASYSSAQRTPGRSGKV